jgi:hypothetical protein
MFGRDDNEQIAQNDATQDTAADSTIGTAAPITGNATVVDTSLPSPSYSAGGYDATATLPPADDTATTPVSASTDPVTPAPVGADDDSDDGLLQIKQQALQQLSPLIGHLDQSAEEKFRTTMMMIQAADNQDLIKEAYAAAQQIEDEKTRAQALLDIVNEINYFTQRQNP